ncbi:dymeclin [Onthophagus taurus]|uniref:dymeclin n=1 Tax=Onthophagus taurus TaxID=166361 RepID=UPI0039BDCEB6
MGTSVSKNQDLTTNEYLLKFVDKDPISQNDPFWNRFLSFNIKPPTSSEDQLALDNKTEPLLQKLLVNNLQSGNFGALVKVFLTRCGELLTAATNNDNIYCWQIFNSLFAIRNILKYLTETVVEEQLIEHIEINVEGTSRLEQLLGALYGIIVDIPLKECTYAIHLEAVTCLIVFLSVQLHTNRKAEQLVIYKLIMKGRHAIHAPLFIKSLIVNFIEQLKAPPGFSTNQGNSLVLGLAGLWSILTLSRRDGDTRDSNGKLDILEAPLATQSLLLMLILTNHCSTQNNPYRQCLFSCLNSQDNNPIPPTKAPSVFKIDYNQLFFTLCKRANGDAATLLLYLLLHRNPAFKTHLLARIDLDQLVIPVLKTLYNAPNSNSHHIYMSLIILLILSEDDAFNRSVHETKLKSIPWYNERNLSEVSLGGLLVLVVIRTIQYNMLKMRDKYLHTNCLAALANMSAQFRDLHPYVSQRLVSLFETLAKKYQKLSLRLKENHHNETTINISMDDGGEAEQDLSVLEEVIRMVLEIFNSCLTNQLSNNPNLVYTLLYKKDIFEPFKKNPAFQDIVQNIETVIEYFSKLLQTKAQQNEVDAGQVLLTIQQGTKQWPKEKLTKFPELKFKYVEEDQPEEFFIPYVWALVSEQSMLNWCTEGSSILNVSC